jgi:hypothetical protein
MASLVVAFDSTRSAMVRLVALALLLVCQTMDRCRPDEECVAPTPQKQFRERIYTTNHITCSARVVC